METFDKDFYLSTLRTYHQVGMEIIPRYKAALLMAIVCVWGNNEGFTLSPKFQCDREYIQEVYHIDGGEIPDNEDFNEELRYYIKQCGGCKDDKDEFFLYCARMIDERYGFKLLI